MIIVQIKLDITGDKGWKTDDMFIPPGYHMQAKIEPESKPAPPVNGQPPFTFPFGAGGMIMNALDLVISRVIDVMTLRGQRRNAWCVDSFIPMYYNSSVKVLFLICISL